MEMVTEIFVGLITLAFFYMVLVIAFRIATFPIKVVAKQVMNERRVEQSPSPLWNAAGRVAGRLFR